MGASENFNNPNLFKENAPGVYTYTEGELGKTASGQLTLSSSPTRDSNAQRTAGGEERRSVESEFGADDGGHLIGARFGGATGEENLTPQNRNLNRGAYKRAENDWAKHLEAGDKVYVNIDSYSGQEGGRPSNYSGYAIIEHTNENGKTFREIEYYSFNNESTMTQDGWEKEEAAFLSENPEYAEEQAAQNTVMEYIWDEDQQDVVKNPYFVESSEETEQSSVGKTASYAPDPVEEEERGPSVYTPTVTVEECGSTQGAKSDYTLTEETGRTSESSGQDLSEGSGSSRGQGMD